jgi:hypothetical protein
MAGEQLEDTCFSLNIVNNLEKNEETKCQCCDTLKADLQKAKQDISSYREIIKILLEEHSITQQQQLRTDEPRKEELFHPISRGTSIKAISRAGIRRSNLVQVIPTANKFEILANVNESNETMCLMSASIVSNVTSIKSKKNDSTVSTKNTRKQ